MVLAVSQATTVLEALPGCVATGLAPAEVASFTADSDDSMTPRMAASSAMSRKMTSLCVYIAPSSVCRHHLTKTCIQDQAFICDQQLLLQFPAESATACAPSCLTLSRHCLSQQLSWTSALTHL